jgi:two-component system, LytTR family, response regulator
MPIIKQILFLRKLLIFEIISTILNQMYTCIIVDDQQEAVNLIKDHVLKIPQLSIQLTTTDSIAALTFLDTNKPDIIFLDIEMPEISGIEFISNIKAKWGNNIPKIVFTTGHTGYALSGFEHGVTDYLLKPITYSRFKQCTDRIIAELDKRNSPAGKPDFFFAEVQGKMVKINLDEIIYIEGSGNYIVIVTDENKMIIYKSMSAIQELLPCDKFTRVHKSYIIAVNQVQAIRGNEIIIKLKDAEKSIPIGKTFKENVLKLLGIN